MGSAGVGAGRVGELGRGRDGVVDVGVSVVLSVLGLVTLVRPSDHTLLPFALVLTLLATSSVAWRSRGPLAAVVVASGAMLGYQWLARAKSVQPTEILAVLLVLYSAGVRGVSRRYLAELAGLAALVIGVCVGLVAASGALKGSMVETDVQPPLVALAAGYLVARQRNLSGQRGAAVAQLQADEELRIAVAGAKERNRVARELHDVVAHGVSVMVVQAGAARITAGAEPHLAGTALGEVVGAGRSAIDELHRVVGTGDPDTARAPFGLAGIWALVEGRRAAGLPVQLGLTGDPGALPDPVTVACYRLVQEALTNVIEHAGAAPTTVELTVYQTVVEVSVRNAAPPASRTRPAPSASGHGLIGMTERVAACGGELRYRPLPDGGFEVHAWMPLDQSLGDLAPRPLQFLNRLRLPGAWSGVVSALAVLCADAAISSSRRSPLALNLSLCAAMAVALLWRRRFPLLFLIAVNALAFPISNGLTSINNATLASTYVFAVPVWTVAAWSQIQTAVAGLLIAIGFEAAEGAHWHLGAGRVVGNAVVSTALWAAARVLRAQRQLSAELDEVRAEVEAGQQVREQLTLAAARSRIVAELDDLVGAHLSVMVAAAESARRMIDAGGRAQDVIGRIEDDGREALAQLRQILGLLRAEHDPGRLAPSLGVEQLHQLVGRHQRSGRTARLQVTGQPAPLLGGVDLVAYRVVESVLAGGCCDTVEVHFDKDSSLRLRFCLAGDRSAWSDPGICAEVEGGGGRIDQTVHEITVRLPVASPP